MPRSPPGTDRASGSPARPGPAIAAGCVLLLPFQIFHSSVPVKFRLFYSLVAFFSLLAVTRLPFPPNSASKGVLFVCFWAFACLFLSFNFYDHATTRAAFPVLRRVFHLYFFKFLLFFSRLLSLFLSLPARRFPSSPLSRSAPRAGPASPRPNLGARFPPGNK